MKLSESYSKRLQELAGLKPSDCDNIKITPEIASEVSKFNSSEELLRAGGISIEALDRAAHGFSSVDIKTLNPEQLNIKWKADMLNPPYQQKKSGLSLKDWAESVDLTTPIDVSYEKEKFWIEDGHHRYYAAKILGKPLNVNLEIKSNPITKLSGDMSYDDFHRCIFKKYQQIEN